LALETKGAASAKESLGALFAPELASTATEKMSMPL
jgi:hypothetical protein